MSLKGFRRIMSTLHQINIGGYRDGVPTPVRDDRRIGLDDDVKEESTLPGVQPMPFLSNGEPVAHVGYFAQDRCKCGAEVFLTPDIASGEKPPTVLFNKSFKIIGCEACRNTKVTAKRG